ETARLLNCHPGLDPGSSNNQPWSKFKTTTTTSLYLAYKRSAISHPLNGFGIIVPPTENKSITAVTFVSSKFDHRCPANHVLFRVFTKQNLLVTLAKARVYADFEAIFKPTQAPVLNKSFTLEYASPKLPADHFEQVDKLEQSLPPGIFVAGCPYKGVSIADCIQQAQASSHKIQSHLTSTPIRCTV
ncbi:MAG: hypothetical protein JKY15_04945, partial [Deltaproteobacteria bacterium]|nr:hypothetical protein [Deltaproteobacteria bacterium]